MSGTAEVLVVMKPLLVEHLVTVLALNGWGCRMTLPLMVGQTCLVQSLKGAARMAAAQSILGDDTSLLSTSLLLILATLL